MEYIKENDEEDTGGEIQGECGNGNGWKMFEKMEEKMEKI